MTNAGPIGAFISYLALRSHPIRHSRPLQMTVEDPVKMSSSTVGGKRSLQSTLNVAVPFPNRENTSTTHKWRKPLVIGHRGSPYHALENTRRSFLIAAEEGCDGIELDVFLLKCGTLVVFHGSDGSDEKQSQPGGLKQYCTVDEGSILDYTAQEARQLLTFNPYFDEFGCGPEYIQTHAKELCIPTLEQVLLDAKRNGILVKIELKGPNTAIPTLQLVEELDMVNQCHYSSFHHHEIQTIRQLRPEKCLDGSYRYKTGALFDQVPDNYISLAQTVGASEIHLKYSTCTRERVEAIHNAGMDSMAWMRGPRGMTYDITNIYDDVGNEDDLMYSILIATGVGNLCVNRPDRLVDYLKRYQGNFLD